jgi:hypothetical protein
MLDAKENGFVLRSLSHPLLMAPLLLWPLILIHRKGLVPSLPAFAGLYWTALSLTSIEVWFFRVLPRALPVLSRIVATLFLASQYETRMGYTSQFVAA